MAHLTSGKRTITCTFIALTAGFFGACVGGQISIAMHTQRCDLGAKQDLSMTGLMKPLCQLKETPGALWQGSTTGLWTGTILGAFIGGLATRNPVNPNQKKKDAKSEISRL